VAALDERCIWAIADSTWPASTLSVNTRGNSSGLNCLSLDVVQAWMATAAVGRLRHFGGWPPAG
jgi:hypothetical protein